MTASCLHESVSSAPGVSFDAEPEGEHAYMSIMNFYVPAQAANGELTADRVYTTSTACWLRPKKRPSHCINVYVFGPVITFDDFSQSGFPGHGRRDAFAAVSLDDGATWKKTNLSRFRRQEFLRRSLTIALFRIRLCPASPC